MSPLSVAELLTEQNRLLSEQCLLLRQIQGKRVAVLQLFQEIPVPAGRMMTDHDCMLICIADDVLAATTRWNKDR